MSSVRSGTPPQKWLILWILRWKWCEKHSNGSNHFLGTISKIAKISKFHFMHPIKPHFWFWDFEIARNRIFELMLAKKSTKSYKTSFLAISKSQNQKWSLMVCIKWNFEILAIFEMVPKISLMVPKKMVWPIWMLFAPFSSQNSQF